MIPRQVCPMHADEDVVGHAFDVQGTYVFTCHRRTGHVVPGPYTWMQAPEPPDEPGLSGLAEDLRLDLELPAAISTYPGQWIEFGVLEAAYAAANQADFAFLVNRYGHTAIKATRYSASAFLASTLGHLSRSGHVLFHAGPATGRWSYNGQISWWALAPEPDWERRTSWLQLRRSMSYVPGSSEE
jgi:hypothetical protein